MTPTVDLAVTKTDGVTTATPGETLNYTIVATNLRQSTDPAVSISDSVPTDLWCIYTSTPSGSATGASSSTMPVAAISDTLAMPASSTVTHDLACNIASSATGNLSNTVAVNRSVFEPLPGSNTATDSDIVLVPQADLLITKSDGVSQATPGAQVFYTIAVSNFGPSADPAASITYTFPPSLRCTHTASLNGGATGTTSTANDIADTLSLPAGASVTYTVDCTVDVAATGAL